MKRDLAASMETITPAFAFAFPELVFGLGKTRAELVGLLRHEIADRSGFMVHVDVLFLIRGDELSQDRLHHRRILVLKPGAGSRGLEDGGITSRLLRIKAAA